METDNWESDKYFIYLVRLLHSCACVIGLELGRLLSNCADMIC